MPRTRPSLIEDCMLLLSSASPEPLTGHGRVGCVNHPAGGDRQPPFSTPRPLSGVTLRSAELSTPRAHHGGSSTATARRAPPTRLRDHESSGRVGGVAVRRVVAAAG